MKTGQQITDVEIFWSGLGLYVQTSFIALYNINISILININIPRVPIQYRERDTENVPK